MLENIFTKGFFISKTVYDNTNSFVYNQYCNMTNDPTIADVVISTYILNNIHPEIFIILNQNEKLELDNYYCYNIYNTNIFISLIKGCFSQFKNKGAREYVCLSLYMLWHNSHIDTFCFPDHNMFRNFQTLLNIASNSLVKNDSISVNSNKRVALLLYGLPRSFKLNYPYIYNEWILPYNTDVYISTEILTTSSNNENITSKNDIDEMIDLYKPKNVYIVDKEEYNKEEQEWEKRRNKIYPKNSSEQFFKIFKGGEMIDESKYDIIIVTRPDLYLYRIEDIYKINTIYANRDQFYIIPNKYFKAFYNLSKILYSFTNVKLKRNLLNDHCNPLPHCDLLPHWLNIPENQVYQHLETITDSTWTTYNAPIIGHGGSGSKYDRHLYVFPLSYCNSLII